MRVCVSVINLSLSLHNLLHAMEQLEVVFVYLVCSLLLKLYSLTTQPNDTL